MLMLGAKDGGGMTTKIRFDNEQAPCGRVIGGERARDRDDDCLLMDHVRYDCGCSRLHDEFHDGSMRLRVVHHSGKIITDELDAGE
ncbi:MAG: hypothetical protein QOD87_1985 [Pseudonocardiales bacterium]|jgi:hypothetical protein|nr:hypothetical protein [Pseudonocardiales bacterium]MDQ1719585.1 hypothetical protein [Pseudonocardiales bacterium]MDQ1750728.1 hypothetical protein [Pseudonocardiales bacterium]